MFKEAYISGAEAAIVKFALSNDFISRAIMNKATQTGARVAPNLLGSMAGNRPALMSLAKNVRAPGAMAATAGQNSLNKVLGKFDYFGSEMSGAGGAQQMPALKRNLAMTGRVRNPSSPLQLEQNITESFGPRPINKKEAPATFARPPLKDSNSVNTSVRAPKRLQQNPGLQPRI